MSFICNVSSFLVLIWFIIYLHNNADKPAMDVR
jgi:hypothetical protein